MTPETLRKLGQAVRSPVGEAMLAAAAAWEFKVWQVEQVVVAKNETIADLRKRLEAVVNGVLDVVDDDVWPVGTNEIRKRIIAALAGEETSIDEAYDNLRRRGLREIT